jgi:hypothetical protein
MAQRRGQVAGAQPVIPHCRDEVDVRWLTQVLARPDAPGARVVHVEVTPVGAGLGLLGQLGRYALTWEGGEGPASVVAKFPAEGSRSRAMAVEMAMYPREVGFYRHLGPTTAIAVGCHHAAIDERTHDFVLVLDDMSGAATIDQLAGCPRARAAEVLTALADLHARHWGESGLDGATWLEPFAGSVLAEQIAGAVAAHWPEVRGRFGDELSPAVAEAGDGLAAALPRVAEALSRPPMTLTHGDLRLDNVFFDQAAGVRLCDWQLSGRSRGARDVAYFVTQSLTVDERRAHEQALVALYADRLSAQGVQGYGVDDVWADVQAGTLLGFAYAIVALGGLDQHDARSAALPRAMLRRSAQAMADHGYSLPE